MNCPKCGMAMDEASQFCNKCGAPAAKPAMGDTPSGGATGAVTQRATKSCPFCGEEILEVALKCRFCGTDLNKPAAAMVHPGAGSHIVLNAPTIPPPVAGMAAAPTIIIQNVQASQAPAHTFVPGQYKNPGLALFLSIIFPGGGQFYNGHVGKGALVFLTSWVILPWIWSWFDAYSSAQRINRVGF